MPFQASKISQNYNKKTKKGAGFALRVTIYSPHNLSVIQALKGYLYPSHNYCADFPMTDRKEA